MRSKQTNHRDNFQLSLSFKDQTPFSKIFEIGNYKIGVFYNKNPSSNEGDNQDSLFVVHTSEGKGKSLKTRFRFGVTDGAGGHPRGKDASLVAAEELISLDDNCVLKKIERANKKILDLKAGAKTTLAFAEIENSKIRFHTVGDSEVIYWNSVGNRIFQSIPHSPTGFKVAADIISQSESLQDSERHYVSSLLGDQFVKISSTSSLELRKGHTILLGSDGLFDNLTHKEIEKVVFSDNFEESFKSLSKICISQDPGSWLKSDDISFVLVKKAGV